MANIPMSNLPIALALDGTEYFWVLQAGTDKRALTSLIAALAPGGNIKVQRSITSSANLPVLASDAILNVNVAGVFAISVPAGAARKGAPLTFKNLPASHAVTLNASGSDTFDGVTTLQLPGGAAVSLVPYNDGVNAGYAIE